MFNLYFQKLKDLLNTIETAESGNIQLAAHKIARSIQKDGIVHVFGCGHSHMFGEELFYRAGGLVPINPILIEDVMLHKGAVRSSQFEKKNDFADQFMGNVDIQPDDVIIVISTSGRNPVPIDVAEFAKKKGAYVIAITSIVYTKSVSSRHKRGIYLADTADVVIDNHIMVGDTLMDLEALQVSFGSGSTVVGAAIVNGIMVEAIELMVKNNFYPPIFKSSNADGADEHNLELINKYKRRIPLLNN
ncbi:SIS domain-containing protein [Neobacillus pocheonensis]|uniref:SIS domain-containing protein n=1 Tax=Neobacillus pocheonensis TaxID=363869 RepID=UPI003D2D4703